MFDPLNNLNFPLWIDDPAQGFVFRRRPGGAPGPGVAGAAVDTEDDEDEREEEERTEREMRRREELSRRRSRVEGLNVNPELKQKMRECLASENTERQNLVERLLDREITEQEFEREVGDMEQAENSWSQIFDRQRAIRQKIHELQWKAASYMEIVPRQKTNFEVLLKKIKALNKQDYVLDRSLLAILHPLSTDDAGRGRRAVIGKDAAKEIYTADPQQEFGFQATMKKHQSTIEGAPDGSGKSTFKKLLVLKKEEGQIERQFALLCEEIDSIIRRHLSKVKSKAEKDNVIKTSSKAVGITLKPGVEIEYEKEDILSLLSPKSTAKIQAISWPWDPPVRDRSGKVVDQSVGVPIIHVSTGSGIAKMTLGRFKKWVDAVDAVEKVGGLDDANKLTGLAAYGLKIAEGMELCYMRRNRDQEKNITTTPVYVRIKEIKDGKIIFNEPVLFKPGFEQADPYDMRESLTFGEFVKWWHRYEVEQSVSLKTTRDLLLKFNEMENKAFGTPEDENPPILLEPWEELKYADESATKFIIEKVDSNDVYLNNGKKYALPEFFHWIKENHVQKVPKKKKSPEELEAEAEHAHDIKEKIEGETHEKDEEQQEGEHRIKTIIEDIKDRQAGSLLGKLADMWHTTQFLSLKDLWNMAKEIGEFVKRKHERRSKGRYGEVGSRLPWIIGPEFERVKQSAENEEVNKYKEAMEQWSVEKVKRTMYDAGSKDLVKACIMTLLHHGEMRWDDHHFWKTLNVLTSRYTLKGAELHIPDPDKIPPGYSGEDMVEAAVNTLWGAGQASSWFQENISKYNSNKNNYEYKFKNLEADPKGTGGPAGECQRLLEVWLNGGYVNPQDYEEMIDGAIKYGKMGAEDKMFYIIAGCVARQGNMNGANPHGETLFSLDRPGELDSKYLNQFPLLDFFTQETVFDPAIYDYKNKRWGKERKFQLKDYERWVDEYFADEFKQCKPGPGFSRFMWEKMLMGEKVRTRISKGIRNAENMDHDDAHLFIPPTTPTEVDGLTTGPTGQKKYFTNSGYANAYPGFNQYIVSLSHVLDEAKEEETKKEKMIALRDTVTAFIRYDAILDNRFLKGEGDRRARLDDRHFQRGTVVDDEVKLKVHQDQLRSLVLEIGRAYGQDWDSWLYGEKTGSYFDKDEKKKQDEYERKLDSLKEVIPKLVEQDGGEKLLQVIKTARDRASSDPDAGNALRGIQKSKRPSGDKLREDRQRAAEAKAERKHQQHAGH